MQINRVENSKQSPTFKGVVAYKVLKKDLPVFKEALESKVVSGKGIFVIENPFYINHEQFCGEMKVFSWAKSHLQQKGVKLAKPMDDDSLLTVYLFSGKEYKKVVSAFKKKISNLKEDLILDFNLHRHKLKAYFNTEANTAFAWDKANLLAIDNSYTRYQKKFDKFLKRINAQPIVHDNSSKSYAAVLRGHNAS